MAKNTNNKPKDSSVHKPDASSGRHRGAHKLRVKLVGAWQRVVVRTQGSPHRTFRLTPLKLHTPTSKDFKAVWGLLWGSWQFVWANKRILVGLGALYAIIAYLLVGGVSQLDYVALKDATVQVADGDLGAVGTAMSMFGAALTGNLSSSPTDMQQMLSAILMLFFWLAIIWATRMLSADKEIKLRDALYNSGTPIIPTLIVLAVTAVQLIPAALGIFAYSTALNGGWLDGGVESMTFAAAAVALSLLSAYFVVSSITAMVVVALPGTYPWQALGYARGLVMGRRWGIVLRIAALLAVVVAAWAVVLVPVFLIDGWLKFDWLPLVPVFMQMLIGITMVYTSVYIYKLYRSLL